MLNYKNNRIKYKNNQMNKIILKLLKIMKLCSSNQKINKNLNNVKN